ncbi:MAG: aldo/keto reductase [Candidatus Woesearchaeota archaeon]
MARTVGLIPGIDLDDGIRIPQVGLGTWQITGENATHAVKTAYELGYRHFDTAQMYGNEADIGKALKDFPREDIFLTSKLWMDKYDKKNAKQACYESLEKLGTGYLDLFLLHWPKEGTDYRELFTVLKELQEEGKIKSVGVSNFTVAHLEKLLPIANEVGLSIVLNQIEFHPYLYQKSLLEYCKNNDIAVTAYSPLAQGKIIGDAVLRNIAQNHDVKPLQVALRWHIQHGLITIPRSASQEHQADNLDIFGFELTSQEMEEIDNLDTWYRVIEPSFAEF